MCRVYGVTRADFYAWRSRERSERECQNETLTHAIREVHAQSRGTYGSPRVHRVLRSRGHCVGKHRVARLMRAHGIKARVARIRYTNPSIQRFFSAIANQSLEVQLDRPDQVWVGDITYLKAGAVYRYLAVVMDKYSRRIVGWSYGPRKDVRLTLRALNSAVRARRPRHGLVFHTDRGIEFAAGAFKARLAELGFVQGMNRPGKITDNAFIESFFHSMKSDIYHGVRYSEDLELQSALKSYVPFYQQGSTSLIIAVRAACDVRTAGATSGVSMKSGEVPTYTSLLRAQRGAANANVSLHGD
jgi:putative transposase